MPALIQGPFLAGDTAANTGTLALLDNLDETADMPVWAKSMAASSQLLSSIFLMPVDTFKTTMQVQGKEGITNF